MKNRELPTELILFVTSRCHLRCKHCFNWKALQRNKDLSMAEIESLARSLPMLKILMMSGGEPFLRKDLVEICRIFISKCRLSLIDIPTSGTLGDATIQTVEKILQLDPSLKLSIGVSLDGMESYHDANRGVSGTFAKAVACCANLLELKRKYKNLSVNVLTTLVQDNKEELLALKDFVAKSLPGIDSLTWGVARGEIKEGEFGHVSPDDLACIDREYLEFNFQNKKKRERAVASKFYALRRKAFLENVQPVPCVAGCRVAVVYDDGGVAPCELLPPVGNLREASFAEIWNSEEMRKAQAGIDARKCACTHECFLAPSYDSYLLRNPLEIVKAEGIYGLYHLLYVKSGISVVTRAIRKVAARLRHGH
ncbi:MAG: radical SAM protein [Pseudomonadota bacterium]